VFTFQSSGSSSTHFPTQTLIIGAGIAGTVAAMALERADIKSIVYEAGGPETGDAGPYVTVAPNGLDALAAIGVDGLVTAGGFLTHTTALFSASGRQVGAIRAGRDSVTIRRGRLLRLLQEAAGHRGIRFEFGKRLAGAAIAQRGVEAWFRDKTHTTGEMLVGCDGAHSLVRRIIDRISPELRDLNQLNFCGHTPLINAGIPGQWQLIFGRHAFFGYAVDPSGGTAWFANVRSEGPFAERHCTTPNADWRRMLIDLFRADEGRAAALIAAGTLDVAADAALDLPHLPHWHTGPFIVLGDAAHAMAHASGQGASLAIEDGVLLAKYLRQLPNAPAFAAFERARRRRVERIVAHGARASRRRVPGALGRVVRNLTPPFVCRAERSLVLPSDHQVDWHQPVVNANR
jgi:FAD-dependent urate hydroxylase